MNDCAVVLVNWNGRSLLETALPALPDGLEVWVVDNASEDDSVEWLSVHHPSVKILVNDRNEGFARANNRALREISRPYVLLLNTDARLTGDGLEKALAWMRDHPRCGLAGANLRHTDGRAQNSVSPHLDLWTECLNRRLVAGLRGTPGKNYPAPARVPGVIGAAMLGRREALAQVDYFDEQFFFFLEETDLCRRLAAADWEIWHLPDWTVEHAQGQSASKRDIAKRIEFHLSRELYIHKHFGRQAAKTLRNWQDFRLALTCRLHLLGRILSLGLWAPRKGEAVRALARWYRLGSPEDQGLRPPGWF